MADVDTTNILVVDDRPQKLLVYATILEELGQNLVAVRSGPEALEQVLKTEFAVILLDVQMPGMDGFETASLIRQRRRSAHTPIIFLTAFADEVRATEGYAAGAVDYIPTPVVPEILRAKVRVFVDLYRMTQRAKRQAAEQVALAEERTKRAAAEEGNRRLGFLAEVSRALADSLDPDTTARTLARQAVPFLADLAGVTLTPDIGHGWRVELAWAAPGDVEPRSCQLAGSDWPRDTLRDAVDQALADGRPQHLTGADLAYPVPPGQGGPAGARIRSAAVLPLRARDRTLGILTLAFGPSGRSHGPDDLALADDLASRAGIALDNARLYRDVQHADRQKNEFLSMLAHELRNPLAPIRNAVEVLRLRGAERPEVRQARDMIDRQVTHLVRLVDDLLDVSRITRGKIQLRPEPVDLADAVRQAVEAGRPMVEQAGHRLEMELPGDPPMVTADPARLAQVVTNLLTNAAKYTEPGGHIRVAVGREGDEAVLRVRDTGVGIPADMLDRVFDLFTQIDRTLDRSHGGLGVGLTLVRRLVELHDGAVVARSDGPGQGSEFEVRLPVRRAAPGAPAAAHRPDPARADRLRVLLVDDNVDGAESLATLVRLAGHEVQVAHDGPSGLEVAVQLRPDVAILDIGLPGMDGYALARHLRSRPETRGALLVAVTGYGRDEDRSQSRAAGMDHHLVKPVQYDALLQALGTAAGR